MTVVTGLLAGGCRDKPSLANTVETREALARTVLEALASGDRSALERLALSEAEFRDVIWPELPAARPERNVPWSYVWQDLSQKNRATLSALMAAHGGRRYQLVALRTAPGITRYGDIEVIRKTEMVVRDAAGDQQTVRLFGSTVNADGRYKVFSYVVD